MPRRSLILTAALASIVALGFLWRSLMGGAPVSQDRSLVEQDVEVAEVVMSSEALEEPAATAKRETLAPQLEAQALTMPSDVHWFDGRVVFPPGLPMDEDFEVEARGRRFGKGKGSPRKHTVRADQNGRFRIAFSKQTRRGWVGIRARYMYQGSNVRVDVKEQEGEIVLEPRLGGVLRGVIAPPANLAATAELFEDARLMLTDWGTEHSFQGLGKISADGSFEFNGVPPSDEYKLELTSRGYAGDRRWNLSVHAGELVEVDLRLTRGARVAGRVVSADGEPIQGASVSLALSLKVGNISHGTELRQKTRHDGSFEFTGVPSCTAANLRVRAPGSLETVEPLGELGNGDRREGLLLGVEMGLTVDGVVSWPDGQPAAGARVKAAALESNDELNWHTPTYRAKADDRGRFELTGLVEKKLVIHASARRALESSGEQAERMQLGSQWIARIEDVEPGTRGVELVLARGEVVRGSVLYAGGLPVGEFSINAQPAWDGETYAWSDPALREFKTEDGEFEITGLEPGPWSFTVHGSGFAETKQTITIPFEGRLDVKVKSAASLTGVVMTPTGEPLAGAEVSLVKIDTSAGSQSPSRGKTDGKGEFVLKSIEPGRYQLSATALTWAPSPAIALELTPGEERAKVVVTLSQPCIVTGVVLPAVGRVAQRQVMIWGGEVHTTKTVLSDERGEFEFLGVGPGRYRARVEPLSSAEDLAMASGTTIEEVTFTAVAGGRTHFEVGAGPQHPIRLHGTVTCAGSAAANYRVRASGGNTANRTSVHTDERGAYSMVVDGPGEYSISISPRSRAVSRTSVDFQLDLPDSSDRREDFELPAAKVSLTLLQLDGTPAVRVPMSFEVLQDGSYVDARRGEGESDSKGRFELRHLAPGTYRVRAGGPAPWDLSGGGFACQFIEVQVSEGAREQRTLSLEPGATLHVSTTHVDGSPVADLVAIAFDGDLRQLGSTWLGESFGRFRLNGLPSGELTIKIESGDAKGEASVHLQAGGKADLSIVVGN